METFYYRATIRLKHNGCIFKEFDITATSEHNALRTAAAWMPEQLDDRYANPSEMFYVTVRPLTKRETMELYPTEVLYEGGI